MKCDFYIKSLISNSHSYLQKNKLTYVTTDMLANLGNHRAKLLLQLINY